MKLWLVLAFLFFSGASIGWVIEFLFRNLVSYKQKKNKLFINPGFCRGPYLPIYGVGLVAMFVITYFVGDLLPNVSPIWVVLVIGLVMTLIELVGGVFMLRVMNLRLWDYRDLRFNIGGVICPQFSLIWTLFGALYYFLVHPLAIDGIIWLSNNLAFSFFIGLFFGVFFIDLFMTFREMHLIKRFGDINDIVVKFEEYKAMVMDIRIEYQEKPNFFHQTELRQYDLFDFLRDHLDLHEAKRDVFKSFRKK